MNKLWKSHRVLGYEVARTSAESGELVILRTNPSSHNSLEVAPAHTLMPATLQEVLMYLRVDILNALERAAFFGLSEEDMRAAFEAELTALHAAALEA